MSKQLKFNQVARRAFKRGVDVVAEAVKTTLGPRGRNVAINTQFGPPDITHDGVTVARAIELADPFENMGARLLVEVASKTNDIVGDGTTTATVLAQAIITEGIKMVVAGANPMQIKRGLDRGAAAITDELHRIAQPVRSRDDIAQVATIASASPEIGNLIADVMERIGKEGVITVEESRSTAFEVNYTDGMQIDRGYISAYFVTNNERMEAELDEPYILLTNQKITAVDEILPVMEQALEVTRNFMVISEDLSGEGLATLVVNKLRGTITPLAIKAPGFGDRRNAILEDIAVLTGGAVISQDRGRTLNSATLADLGRARRVVATHDTTTFIDGYGDTQAIQARTEQIRSQIAASDSDFDREKLQERLAKLTGGVAVLKVGGATEPELKEKKHRVEDALATARAAVEEGIIPGGGVALINALCVLDTLQTSGDDERFGIQILRRALEEPMRQLATNAGEEGAVIIAAVRRHQIELNDINWGYNVLTNTFGNMLEQGVVDPVKVTRSAVQNAVSIAGLLLTTEVLIADTIEDSLTATVPGEDMGF